MTNCPNCTAPVDRTTKKCPYCGTPYLRPTAPIRTRPTVSSVMAGLLAGVMTVNEARASLGLDPVEGGDD